MQDLFEIINYLWMTDAFMKQQRLIEEMILNRKSIAKQGATGVEKSIEGGHKP